MKKDEILAELNDLLRLQTEAIAEHFPFKLSETSEYTERGKRIEELFLLLKSQKSD